MGVSATRQGDRYGVELNVGNTAARIPLSIEDSDGVTLKGGENSPAASQAYTYDLDGNLTNDGVWEYMWDAENRLNSAEYLLATTDAEKRKLSYLYDYKSRRILRRELHWDSAKAGWSAQHQTKYIYNGWNVIAEILNETTVSKTYTWGTDFSGTMQGAGGVGGLLSVSDQILAIDAAYMYDGNGNVTGLVEKGTDNLIAEYEYTAFGETLTAKGSYASQNIYRFSTKPIEKETGFYYYGYRYYNPVTGTWPSRDPIGEEGGYNLYGFVKNNGINKYDYLGKISREQVWDEWLNKNVNNKKLLAERQKQFAENASKQWKKYQQTGDPNAKKAAEKFSQRAKDIGDTLKANKKLNAGCKVSAFGIAAAWLGTMQTSNAPTIGSTSREVVFHGKFRKTGDPSKSTLDPKKCCICFYTKIYKVTPHGSMLTYTTHASHYMYEVNDENCPNNSIPSGAVLLK